MGKGIRRRPPHPPAQQERLRRAVKRIQAGNPRPGDWGLVLQEYARLHKRVIERLKVNIPAAFKMAAERVVALRDTLQQALDRYAEMVEREKSRRAAIDKGARLP